MKYLFIVQGEGRGHMTQAMTLEKMLLRNGHEVVGIMVGTSATRKIPEFFLRSVSADVMEYTSMNFRPSHRNRKPNMFGTVLYNIFAFVRYFPSIRRIRRQILSSGADVVVNFYELLVGLTYMGHRLRVPCVSIGHQYLFLHRDFGIPLGKYPGHEGLNILSRINSYGSKKLLALSFNRMPDDMDRRIRVVPPLLRTEVLSLRNPDGSPGSGMSDGDYILGYMLNSGFSEDVLEWHARHPEISLNAFHILLQKFLPCSICASSYRISFPAELHRSIPRRTASAPYLSIRSSGSGELPRVLDIFLPSLSLTMPVR